MRFTKDHEFIDASGPVATIGISEHAQEQLGDIVFVDLPKVGAVFKAGEPAAVVESVKAASDVFCPVAGEVLAVNEKLNAEPSLVNEDAQGRGWLFKIKLADPSAPDAFMDEIAYADFLKTIV
jgi:glycine cleavage system H protein